MVLSYAYKGTIACLYWDVPRLFFCSRIAWIPLQWHHNEHDCISNHQHHDFYSTVYSSADQRKHQSSASLALVRGIHQVLVNSPYKRPVTQKMFPFDDVIMFRCYNNAVQYNLILYAVPEAEPGINLCMCPANGRWRYIVTSSLIGCVHTQNDHREYKL